MCIKCEHKVIANSLLLSLMFCQIWERHNMGGNHVYDFIMDRNFTNTQFIWWYFLLGWHRESRLFYTRTSHHPVPLNCHQTSIQWGLYSLGWASDGPWQPPPLGSLGLRKVCVILGGRRNQVNPFEVRRFLLFLLSFFFFSPANPIRAWSPGMKMVAR